MSSVPLVAVLFCLISASLGSTSAKLNGVLTHDNFRQRICKAEAELLHRKYQEAFNAGDLDRLIKLYDPRAVYFYFDEGIKTGGRDAIIPLLKELMAHSAEIDINPEFEVQMLHGFHAFYVYGKMTKRSKTQGPETIFYKQRIIRVDKYKGHEAGEFRIWTEHLSHREIKPQPIVHA